MDKLPFGPGHGAPVEVFHGLTSLRLGTMGLGSAMLWESKRVAGLGFSVSGSHAPGDFLTAVKDGITAP